MLAGCASTATKPSPAGFLDELIRNSEKRAAVSGTVMVTTDLDGKSVSLPGVLLAEFPDHLRLELQDPVGGILVLLVLNGDRFSLYRHDRAEVLNGPLAKLPAGLLPHISAGDVVRVFLARPNVEHVRRSERQDHQAVFRDGARLETLLWDGDFAEPSEWRQSVAGQGGTSALYENYEFKSGLRYPTKIRLAGAGRDGQKREILLAWKDWEPSVPTAKKLFQIPQQENFGRKIKELR